MTMFCKFSIKKQRISLYADGTRISSKIEKTDV